MRWDIPEQPDEEMAPHILTVKRIANVVPPEQPDEEMVVHDFTVKKIAHVVPVSIEQLLDAGHPVTPEMAAAVRPTPKLSRRARWRMARAEAVERLRRRIGFWIAGYEPDDEDW
ncbi:hypothetical protein [Streptomyces murinus]